MTQQTGFYSEHTCDIDEFRALISQTQTMDSVPNATRIESNVPIYDMQSIGDGLIDPKNRRVLMAEWAQVLQHGAGVFVLKQAQPNHAAIDKATAAYIQIIEDEKNAGGESSDHFAAAGTNDRIWNSLQKLCQADPETFMAYFACPAVDAASESWLGPNYQMTAQINLVHPGGQAQLAHRDYHLGFQTADISAMYPAHVHDLSPLMTLQGGIAHCDMSVESGPTKLLPFSQKYAPGYAAWRRDDFRALFEEHYVQLPLKKGDAIFFNPALFHGAGENRSTDVHRMVNLLHVSSPFGRAMEQIDRDAMCKTLYPVLQAALNAGSLSEPERDAVIASTAEGYSFPTNLDLDPPIGGLAPETQAALMKRALIENIAQADFATLIDAQTKRQSA